MDPNKTIRVFMFDTPPLNGKTRPSAEVVDPSSVKDKIAYLADSKETKQDFTYPFPDFYHVNLIGDEFAINGDHADYKLYLLAKDFIEKYEKYLYAFDMKKSEESGKKNENQLQISDDFVNLFKQVDEGLQHMMKEVNSKSKKSTTRAVDLYRRDRVATAKQGYESVREVLMDFVQSECVDDQSVEALRKMREKIFDTPRIFELRQIREFKAIRKLEPDCFPLGREEVLLFLSKQYSLVCNDVDMPGTDFLRSFCFLCLDE